MNNFFYLQTNDLCTKDYHIASDWHSFKIPIILVLLTITNIVLEMQHIMQNALYIAIYEMYFLTSFCEIMLMHIITSSIRDGYKTINKLLYLKNAEMPQNQIFPVNSQKNLKRIGNSVDMKKIQYLLEKHYQLTLLAKDTNNFFGIPMLIALSSIFEAFTIDIYYALTKFKLGSVDFITVFRTVFWLISRMLCIWYTVKAWDSIAKEVKFSLNYMTIFTTKLM